MQPSPWAETLSSPILRWGYLAVMIVLMYFSGSYLLNWYQNSCYFEGDRESVYACCDRV